MMGDPVLKMRSGIIGVPQHERGRATIPMLYDWCSLTPAGISERLDNAVLAQGEEGEGGQSLV